MRASRPGIGVPTQPVPTVSSWASSSAADVESGLDHAEGFVPRDAPAHLDRRMSACGMAEQMTRRTE